MVAKPDRTIKIPGVSPWRLPRALSCSCLSVYRCHSAVMAAFVSFHAWHSVPGRQFAPSWTVCTNPPFSPTAAPYPVTINLSPTRKDTIKRHWQQPLVDRMCERCIESSWSGALTTATLKGQIGDMSRTRLLPRLENLPGLTNLRKTTCQGGFFVSWIRDYDDKWWISRRSF